MKKALAFMAHPDDAEILCCGTLLRLKQVGWETHILSVSSGSSDCRLCEASKSAGILGATYHSLLEKDGLVFYNRQSMLKACLFLRSVAPDLIFTHSPRDYHVDHEQTSLLSRAASFQYALSGVCDIPFFGVMPPLPHLYYCDPIGGKDIFGQCAEPTTFVNISAQMPCKIMALGCHNSQLESEETVLSSEGYLDLVRRIAAIRGRQIGADYAEAFVLHVGYQYPTNDVLMEALGK